MPDVMELKRAASLLREAGIYDPGREAAAIWAWVTGCSLGNAWIARDTAAAEDQAIIFHDAVSRRARGEPLAYVLGSAGFRRLELEVDRRVLIPRPETEGLVERVLDWAGGRWAEWADWGSAAEIGTGSGCIALSLALEGRFSRVVATDVSAGALEVAAANASHLSPAIPVDLRLGSLLQPLSGEVFDAIVANPPYLTEYEFDQAEWSVRGFEPRVALVSGGDGLRHTQELIQGSSAHLLPGGLLAVELDSRRAERAVALALRAGYANAKVELDVFGRPRYLLATKGTT